MIARDVPACAFSIGFERLIVIHTEQAPGTAGPALAASARRVALLVNAEVDADLAPALAAARALRAAGDLVSLEVRRKNLGRQLESLAEHGFTAFATVEGQGPPTVKPLAARKGRE
jgi:histidyl-tRNA synthetase